MKRPSLGKVLKVAGALVALATFVVFGLYFWWGRHDAARIERLQQCIDQETPAWIEKLKRGEVVLGEPEIYLDPIEGEETAIFPFLHGEGRVAHRALRVSTKGEPDGTGPSTCEAKEALVD